jgi:hypothetical protein
MAGEWCAVIVVLWYCGIVVLWFVFLVCGMWYVVCGMMLTSYNHTKYNQANTTKCFIASTLVPLRATAM